LPYRKKTRHESGKIWNGKEASPASEGAVGWGITYPQRAGLVEKKADGLFYATAEGVKVARNSRRRSNKKSAASGASFCLTA
jgi:hypothetical protein